MFICVSGPVEKQPGKVAAKEQVAATEEQVFSVFIKQRLAI